MKQFTYKDSLLTIYCPKLANEEAFEIAIENACAAIKVYKGKFFIEFGNEEEESIDFWEKLVEDPKRYPLGAKYLSACMERLKENEYLFEDECPLGSYVAYKLALTYKYFLPYYAELLGHWDMDHEVEEIEYISEIAEHHG